MLKAIIIDDEKKIIALIEGLVDWREIGIEIIGTATSGKQGMEMILERHPDIVVTDIRMPGIDGLEMIHQLKSMGLDISFVLISGHKHFEYAHTAIKYGVENYLLKPINKQELRDNLISVRDKILNERDVMTEQISIKNKIEIVSGKMRNQFISKLVRGERIAGDTLSALNQEYMLSLQDGNFQMAVVKADLKKHLEKEQITIMNHKVSSMLTNQFEQVSNECISIIYQGFIVIFLNYNDVDIAKCCEQLLADGKYKFDEYCDITIGLSEICNQDIDRFHALYQEALINIRSRIILGANRVITTDQTADGSIASRYAGIKGLNEVFEIRDRDKIAAWLYEYFSFLRNKHMGVRQIFADFSEIYDILNIEIYKQKPDFKFPIEKQEFLENLDDARSITELREDLKAFIGDVFDLYEEELNHKEKKVIRMAKDYITEHYAENISLESIAHVIYMNPAYFSVLFKKEEGVNFSDYLTKFRIDMAKKLLKEDRCGIKEISNKVGYKDARYFSQLFQKYVGIKPSEYRKLYI